MHMLYSNFLRSFGICKNLINEQGNILRRGVVFHFSDFDVMSLSLTADHLRIDRENNLFLIPIYSLKFLTDLI
jgi:hypothetical protein